MHMCINMRMCIPARVGWLFFPPRARIAVFRKQASNELRSMPTSFSKRGGRPVTAQHACSEIFALLVATFLKGAQMCNMNPIIRNAAGAALNVLNITPRTWTSTEIFRFVTEPCLRKLSDSELGPYINKLMGQVPGREGRQAKTLEILRDIMLFFIYHIAQVDKAAPVVDYQSFMTLCNKVC